MDAGAFGRVALATVIGTSSPVLVAIKVYGKDQLGATPRLDAMHDNECRIMCENERRDSRWLVRSRGAFGDAWNRYLVMVRRRCLIAPFDSSFLVSVWRRIITPTRLLASFSAATIGPRRASSVSGLKSLYVPRLVWQLHRTQNSWRIQALAVYELYNQRIVHCDLKPSNILVTWDGHIAIADFGISLTPNLESYDSEDEPFDQCVFFAYGGTYAYQAPELLIKHARASFTCAVDMWSLGVIIYEMYTGKVSPVAAMPGQT